jgi:hypothetical protein
MAAKPFWLAIVRNGVLRLAYLIKRNGVRWRGRHIFRDASREVNTFMARDGAKGIRAVTRTANGG